MIGKVYLYIVSITVSVAALLSLHTISTHAQAALAFSASAPAEQPAQGLLLGALEEPVIDLSEWHTGGTGPFTYKVTGWTTNPLGLPNIGNNFACVDAEVAGSTLTLTPGALTPLSGGFRERCADDFNVKITEADGTEINRVFRIERNLSVVAPVPLIANSNEIVDIAINKGALNTHSIGRGFQGGIGTVTYTAASSNTACVTLAEAIGTSTISTTEQERRQLGVSVSATSTPEECSATITVTATDDHDSTTAERTFTVYTPTLSLKTGASIADKNLAIGADPITINNVSQHFEGGVPITVNYEVSAVNDSITPSDSNTACATVSALDASNNFTVTPHNDQAVTHCVSLVTISASTSAAPKTLTFTVTVTPTGTVTPPPATSTPLALSSTTFPDLTQLNGGESTTPYDLAQYFTGGTGDITYAFTSDNDSCVTATIDQTADTLVITALTPDNNCRARGIIKATDSAGTPTSVSITNIIVDVVIPFTVTATAPDTAQANPIPLTQGTAQDFNVGGWFQGGDGDFATFTTTIQSADATVPTCVTPTILGTTLTLTPHNDNTQPTCTSQFRITFTDGGGSGLTTSFDFWATVPAVTPPAPLITFFNGSASNGRYDQEFQENEGFGWFGSVSLDGGGELRTINDAQSIGNTLGVTLEIGGTAVLGTDYTLNYSNTGSATQGSMTAASSTFSICATDDPDAGWVGQNWRNVIFIDPNDIHGADKTITLKITEVSLGSCTGGNTAFDRFESDTLTTTIVNTDSSTPPAATTPLITFFNGSASNGRYDQEFQETEGFAWFSSVSLDAEGELSTINNVQGTSNSLGVTLEIGGTAVLGTDYNLNYSSGTATIGNIAATSSTFSICAVYDSSGGWGGTDWRNIIFIDPNDIHGADKTITLKITEVSLGSCTGGNTAFDRFESDTLTTTIVNTDSSTPPAATTPLITFFNNAASNGRYNQEFQENENWNFFTAFNLDESELPGIVGGDGATMEINLELGGTAVLGTDYTIRHSTSIGITSSPFSICYSYDQSGGWVLSSTGSFGGDIEINPNDIHDTDKTITLKITGVDDTCGGGGSAVDRFESDTLTTTIVNTDSSTTPPPATPLALSSTTFPDLTPLNGGESTTPYDLAQYFTGGTGDITYAFTSDNDSCVTATIDQTADTLVITALTPDNNCRARGIIKATDSAGTPTSASITNIIVDVVIPFTVTATAPDTAQANPIPLTQGTAQDFNVGGWFQGGDGDFATFTTTIQSADATVPTCVTPTILGTTLTLTPHNDNTQPTCTSQFRITFTDGGGSGLTTSFDFWATVPAVTPPAVPITLTAAGSATTTVTYIRGLDSFPFAADLTTLFAGGTGALTFTVSSSNTNCVATNIAGNTLNLITHLDSTIVGQCSSTIKVTATDTTGATKDTPGDTVQVGAPTPFILSGANTLSDATLARGASSSVFDLSNYINGGNGDITYSATTDDDTCVTFAITGADFTYTAHNTAAKSAQCIANIVVTATDGHLPVPQTIDTASFAITVPATTTTPPTPPANPITVTAGGSLTGPIAYTRGFPISTDLTGWFSGGTGTLTFSASSSNQSCVAVNVAGNTLTITPHIDSTIVGQCESVIKATATDTTGATKDTPGLAIQIFAPTPFTLSGVNTFSDATLARGASSAVFDLTDYITGGNGDITYSATTDDDTCVDFTLTGDDSNLFTYTAHNTAAKTAQCVANIVVTATDGHLPVPQTIDTASFAITVPAPITLTAVGSFTTTLIDQTRGEAVSYDLTIWFSGGTGTFTYTASSSNTNCVTANVAGTTLTTTNHTDSTIAGQCESVIKVTATDTTGATKDTPGYTVQVVGPTPFNLSGANTFSSATLARGASSAVFDLTDYIEGGNGNITYSATTDDNTCVDFTITGEDFTYTAHNTAAKTAQCVANIVVTATDSHAPTPQTIDTASFAITVPATTTTPPTPPANPITITSAGSFFSTAGTIPILRGQTIDYDLTTWFSGGTGTLTFSASSSNTDCIAVNVAGNIFTTTAHTSSTIAGNCSSIIKATATDTTGATKTIPEFTLEVPAHTTLTVHATNTFSDATLARGASTSTFDLDTYFSGRREGSTGLFTTHTPGGNGDITYSATTDDDTCVDFTITGDDFTYTAHNTAAKTAQCVANIVVTATDSTTPVAQTVDTASFAITVPAATSQSLRASPTTRLSNITLVEGRSTTIQDLSQYFQGGTQPYTFAASTDDATNCAQNTATISTNTLALTAHRDNSGECASTLVTVTATDTAGDTATQTLTLTVRNRSRGGGGVVGLSLFNAPANETNETRSISFVSPSTDALVRRATITKGMRSPLIQLFQQQLNNQGYPVSAAGAGSPGQETDYFGSRTENALLRFQAANNLSQTGVFDHETQEVLINESRNELIRSITERIMIIRARIQEILEG